MEAGVDSQGVVKTSNEIGGERSFMSKGGFTPSFAKKAPFSPCQTPFVKIFTGATEVKRNENQTTTRPDHCKTS